MHFVNPNGVQLRKLSGRSLLKVKSVKIDDGLDVIYLCLRGKISSFCIYVCLEDSESK